MFRKGSNSAFQGKIEEIPGLYVDNFENVEHKKPRVFFLSHCHSDHMQGLHSAGLLKYLMENNVYIYTTEVSAAIIKDEVRDIRILDYVKTLSLGSTIVVMPTLPDGTPEIYLTVTLIPAGHSAGAVMYLFQTTFTTVLFTGDFRIDESDIHKYRGLHEEDGTPIKIKTMYLDTTFIDVMYENFPRRSRSIEDLINELRKCTGAEWGVALHTSAKYGYEFVFNEIYRVLGRKVYVNEDRWKFYRTIPHLVPGVTNNKWETKIHLCTKRSEKDHSQCIPPKFKKFIYVHLSAMKWINNYNYKSVQRVSPTRIDVCFATHCSRSELLAFVEYFEPDKVIGFPNRYLPYLTSRSTKRKYDDFCNTNELEKDNFDSDNI